MQASRLFAAFSIRLLLQPRVLPLDHALVQLLEQRRRLPQRLPRRQLTLRPGADGTAVVVGQRQAGARLFLILNHVLRAKELALVAQVLMQLLRRVCGRIGARIVFRLSTTRTLCVTYTLVAAAS